MAIVIPVTLHTPADRTLSVIIPTRNRCPYNVREYRKNPLVWCLYSLFEQQDSGLNKIVLINDNSNDFTECVIRHIAAFSPVEIVYIENSVSRGPGQSRNVGIGSTDSDQLFFLDDDCILSPRALSLAQQCYAQLNARGNVHVGALHLPTFLRSADYDGEISSDRIGKTYPQSGEAYTNFRLFPEEYRNERHRRDVALCLPIDFFHEVFLIDTAAFRQAGGFREVGFSAIAHEGMILSLALGKSRLANFQIFHPDCHSIHFRYGSPHPPVPEDVRHPGLWIDGQHITLDVMLRESQVKRHDTGGRASAEEIIRDVIAGRYAQLQSLHPRGGTSWARIAFNALVNGRDEAALCRFPATELNQAQRITLWKDALLLGRRIYERELA
jgi:glycosyltransferase involved in cell wall biosynthesis